MVLDYDLLDGWMDGEGENTETWAWASFGLVRYTIFVRLFCSGDLWRILGDFNRFLERSSL